MKTMSLTAKSYADLRPFEMLAKRFGIAVKFQDEKPTALENYKILAKESRAAAKRAGLSANDVAAAIKEVRKRNARSH